MLKDKNKSRKNGGFYIALCGCAVVVALVSYVGNMMKANKELPEPENIALNDIDKYDFESYEEESSLKDSKEVSEPEIIVVEPEPEVIEPVEETAAKEEVDEFLPALPVSGKVTAEFSGDNLVHYERLDDWRTHSGVDISANVGDDVYICESGVVEKIYSNNMGGCILVDHKNGYKSLYANLGEIDLVKEGDELVSGETIGRVGETAVGDITAQPHVHFELYHEGKAVNPLDIITIE